MPPHAGGREDRYFGGMAPPCPRTRRRLVTGTLSLLALAVGGCEPPAATIGFTYNWGDSALESFVAAEVARTRPPGGREILLQASRSGGWAAYGATPLAAEVRRATILSNDPSVVAVVGPGGSREALQVAPIYAAARLAHLVPTATSRLLSGTSTYTLRLAADDSVQGAFIAAYADTVLRLRRLAIFYVPDEYGIGLAAGTAADAAARQLAIVDRSPIRLTQDCMNAEDRAHYDGIVDELALHATPDGVVIAARTVEAACLTRALRDRWPLLHILAGDGVFLEKLFFDRATGHAEGVHLVAFWHPELPSPASRAFLERFRAARGRTPRHGDAVFLDAALMVAEAIRAVGVDRADVHAYLLSLGNSRPPYEGVTGRIGFSAAVPHPLLMTRVTGDSSRLVAGR
jgi:ABC-type branched-subunit amino acid transport system substrate-binding protein